jgi:hypothetical protein
MTKSRSPFAGKSLTEGTSLANTSIEQRLFSKSPTQAGTEKPTEPVQTKKPETQEVQWGVINVAVHLLLVLLPFLVCNYRIG